MNDRRPCILIVDDDENVVFALTSWLEGHGCQVFSTCSSQTAFDFLKVSEPAVALLDIVLPGMNGLALGAEIRSRWPDCQFLLITGHSSVETAADAIRLGAYDYLCKPFESLDAIWEAVQRALDRRQDALEARALLERGLHIEAEVDSLITKSRR